MINHVNAGVPFPNRPELNKLPSFKIGVNGEERCTFLQNLDEEHEQLISNYSEAVIRAQQLDEQYFRENKYHIMLKNSFKFAKILGICGFSIGLIASFSIPEENIIFNKGNAFIQIACGVSTIAGGVFGAISGYVKARLHQEQKNLAIHGFYHHEGEWMITKISEARERIELLNGNRSEEPFLEEIRQLNLITELFKNDIKLIPGYLNTAEV
jgi:hypothetical protein